MVQRGLVFVGRLFATEVNWFPNAGIIEIVVLEIKSGVYIKQWFQNDTLYSLNIPLSPRARSRATRLSVPGITTPLLFVAILENDKHTRHVSNTKMKDGKVIY